MRINNFFFSAPLLASVLVLGTLSCNSPIVDIPFSETTFADSGASTEPTTGPDSSSQGPQGDETTTGTSDASTEPPAVYRCGNGVLDPQEECDDGNSDDTDACLSTCTVAICGDGFVWAEIEGCDDGNEVDSDACLSSCIPATCGDGHVQVGVENCDDANLDDTDDCTSLCRSASCGDGLLHADVEICDDAGESATCDSDCTQVVCGDGLTNAAAGEECDDGNGSYLDNCHSTCKAPSMRVFLSSELYNGDLGGVAGADAKCQTLADAAQVGGKFRAWLWTSIHPEETFYHSPGRYIRLDGVAVAKNYEQLASGELLAPFNVTELKQVVTGDEPNPYSVNVPYSTTWTGSNPTYFDYNNKPHDTCAGWTIDEDDVPTWYFGGTSRAETTFIGFQGGGMGGVSVTEWACGAYAHLLCVQQAWYDEPPRPG